jgi:uncharacterized membrane protein
MDLTHSTHFFHHYRNAGKSLSSLRVILGVILVFCVFGPPQFCVGDIWKHPRSLQMPYAATPPIHSELMEENHVIIGFGNWDYVQIRENMI